MSLFALHLQPATSEAPGAPEIPGFRLRHFAGPTDFPAMVEIFNRSAAADGVERVTSLLEATNFYTHTVNCSPERDLIMAEVSRSLVGYARASWREEPSGLRLYIHWAVLLPEWRRMGIGRDHADENSRHNRLRGYTEDVCVRRPWRRRGLARALLARSLQVLRERGMTEAALGVDTENPSGALRLYESLGYRPVQRWTVYRKPMEAASGSSPRLEDFELLRAFTPGCDVSTDNAVPTAPTLPQRRCTLARSAMRKGGVMATSVGLWNCPRRLSAPPGEPDTRGRSR